MQGRIVHIAEDGTETVVTDAVGALYDLAVGSMDFRSGFWSYEDAKPVAELAEVCGYENREEIAKYRDAQMQFTQQQAFIAQHQEQIYPRRGFIDQYAAQYGALVQHEHAFSTLGKCMWPGCDIRE